MESLNVSLIQQASIWCSPWTRHYAGHRVLKCCRKCRCSTLVTHNTTQSGRIEHVVGGREEARRKSKARCKRRRGRNRWSEVLGTGWQVGMEPEEDSIPFSFFEKSLKVKQFPGQQEPFENLSLLSVWIWKESEVRAFFTIFTSGHAPRHCFLLPKGPAALYIFSLRFP